MSEELKKEELERLYINEKLSLSEIEKKLGVNRGTVFNRLRSYGIKTRDYSEAAKISRRKAYGKVGYYHCYIESKDDYTSIEPEILAYIAGFFDGEGCISMQVQSILASRFGYRIQPVVMITQKDKSILEWIADVLQIKKRIYRNAGCYVLVIRTYHDLRKFAFYLGKYIRVKYLQLEWLRVALDTLGDWTANYSNLMDKEKFINLIQIAKEMRELNNAVQVKIDLDDLERKVRGAGI